MDFIVGVDIGGTFTDCCVVDSDGERHLSKSLTTPGELESGVLAALEVNAESLGLTRAELLSRTTRFVHSTTQATNAILTRNGACTGLITTRGHEQSLIIGNVSAKIAGLPEAEILHSSRLAKPSPIIPRALTIGINERVDRDGDVLVAIDEQEVAAAIDTLVAAGVEAIAVSFLWSFLRRDHELVVKRVIAERAPHVFAAFSHEVAPVIGEYERTATTALTAYVGPKVSGYLAKLEADLQRDGLTQPMLVMQASGGLTSVPDAAQRPLLTLDSGPTGGVLGCRYLGSLYGNDNMICTDVGGTSFDVGLVLDGRVSVDHEPVVSQFGLRLPKVLVRSIGAGGGSIAWIDEGGLLRVGPQSAGSRPGPACYGQGGVEATVTDADLILGHLDPHTFLGGRMTLNKDLAREALARLGERLGQTPEEVAVGVSRIINAQMADLIRRSTIELGHDPRECQLVAYGGAGPTHAVFYAQDIGAKSIVVPADSTVFSAEGILTCDLAHTEEGSHLVRGPFSDEDCAATAQRLTELGRRVVDRFGAENIPADEVRLRYTVGMRFGSQVMSLDIEVDPVALVEPNGGSDLIERFVARYSSLYGEGSLLAIGGVELEMHRAVGVKPTDPVTFTAAPAATSDPSAAHAGRRPAYFDVSGFVDTDVFIGETLPIGSLVAGPAIIERMGDSVVIPPGFRALVDRFGNLDIARVDEFAALTATFATEAVLADRTAR